VAETIVSVFDPLPPQRAFLKSNAFIRGYGGAMGGGKSRCGCEAVFDAALDHPGLQALVARQAHTSIVETTKKTMLNQVIDPRLITRQRASAGEDFVELWNGSRIHFVGLDDPIRWYSSEIGYVFFDEAQEIEEDTVLRIITRLRQRCPACERANLRCSHMPNRAILTFNPGNPGHWLQRWFMEGGQRTAHGFEKPELWMQGATSSIGNAEFFFAKASDNPHLPPGYVDQTLAGMKEWMRRRYLEGLWEFISGQCFFDLDALHHYEQLAHKTMPLLSGVTSGDIAEDIAYRTGRTLQKPQDALRIVPGRGPLTVWKPPFRAHTDHEGVFYEPHRYVVSIDASSGRAEDWSAIQVIDVDTFEQVAEWQDKKETGIVADEAYRIGRLYNDAMIVPEISGGWGLAVDQVLKRYRYPRLYTRRVIDRLSQVWTDRTGWDTTVRTRMVILEHLETVLKEREFGLYSLRSVNEMGTFVYSDREKAEAQPGCNDDLVMALAIGVKVASDLPREKAKVPIERFEPTLAAAGW
jgi:hypothetical protein